MSVTTWLPSDEIRARLSAENCELFNWIYENTRDGQVATLLFGAMARYATEHPEITFWQAARLAKEQFTIISGRAVPPLTG